MIRRNWTRDELIVAFNLYCKLQFGQCHGRNPQVIALANVLDRTPGAVAMKLCNFASLDPMHQRRGVVGLGNAGRSDRDIWNEFNADWNQLGVESERAFRALLGESSDDLTEAVDSDASLEQDIINISPTPTETERLQTVRLGQAFFRTTVLASYHAQCCMCRLPCPELLIASHIVPWATDPSLRLDPRNGLCLCALHDKAFDRGLISVNPDFQVVISQQLEAHLPHSIIEAMFIAFRDQPIELPEKFGPNPEHLEFHRANIFQAT